jgi:hypothetical protein
MPFVGIGPQFDTSADVPAEVISPALPGNAYDSIGEALDVFIATHAGADSGWRLD